MTHNQPRNTYRAADADCAWADCGALVGGASLKVEAFAPIIDAG